MVARIYIGRLSRDARERDVENFFKGYGRIIDVALKDGYGFVNFEDDRDADDAVFDLNGKELCGGRVIIERARSPSSRRDVRGGNNFVGRGRGFPSRRSFGRDRGGYSSDFRPRNPPQRSENRVLVENLSNRVSWQDLKDLMKKVGNVTFADAHKIRQGDGIVEFSSSSDVKRAIEKYDGYEFEGKKLRVKDGTKRSRSRSRSRSYSRSRSGSRNDRKEGSGRRDGGNRSRSRSRSRSDRDTKEHDDGVEDVRKSESRKRDEPKSHSPSVESDH